MLVSLSLRSIVTAEKLQLNTFILICKHFRFRISTYKSMTDDRRETQWNIEVGHNQRLHWMNHFQWSFSRIEFFRGCHMMLSKYAFIENSRAVYPCFCISKTDSPLEWELHENRSDFPMLTCHNSAVVEVFSANNTVLSLQKYQHDGNAWAWAFSIRLAFNLFNIWPLDRIQRFKIKHWKIHSHRNASSNKILGKMTKRANERSHRYV